MAGTPEFKSATTTTRRSGEEVRLPALRPMCAVGWGEARWADEVSPRHRPECAPAYCDGSWPLPPTLGVPSSTRDPSRRALRSRRPMSPPSRSPLCLSRPQAAARLQGPATRPPAPFSVSDLCEKRFHISNFIGDRWRNPLQPSLSSQRAMAKWRERYGSRSI